MALLEFDQEYSGSAEAPPAVEAAPQIVRLPGLEEQRALHELASVYSEGFSGYMSSRRFGIEGLTVFRISVMKKRVLLAIRRNNPPAVSVEEGSWSEESVSLKIEPAGKPPYGIIIMFPNGSDRIDTLNGNVKKYCLEVIYAAHDGVTPMRLIAANQRGKRITKNIQGRLIDHVMILAGVNGTTVEGVNDSGGFVVIHS